MDNVLELHEFFVEGKNHKASHVLLHIAEPVSAHEKERGYFFVIAEINNGFESQIQQLQDIIDEIESAYYDEDKKDETLEDILQDINRRGHHLLKHKDTEVHCLVATLADNKLSLAYHGTPEALLYYPSKGKLSSTKILDHESSGDNQQLFSEIIEGNINPGDYVFACTPQVFDYFTRDRVRKILDAKRTRDSATHVEKVLQDMREKASFGGMIVHLTDRSDKPKTGRVPKGQPRGSAESLEKLHTAAKNTEETLSPPLFANLKSKAKRAVEEKKEKKQAQKQEKQEQEKAKRLHKKYRVETNYRRKETKNQESLFGKLLIALGSGLIFIGTAIAHVARGIVQVCIKTVHTLSALIFNKNNSRERTVEMWHMNAKNKKQFIAELPMLSKILLGVTLGLGIVFVGSVGYLKFKESRTARIAAYDNVVLAIVDKKDAAEAALIYDEKNKAFTLLKEAEALLKDLPQKKRKQREKAEELQGELDVFLQKLRNMHVVSPNMIVDLAATNEKASTQNIALLQNSILAFGEQDDTLYTINTINNSVQTTALETTKNFRHASASDEEVVFMSTGNNITIFENESKTLTPKTIGFPSDNAVIGDITLYNNKVYSVDTKQSNIYKHNKTQTGYDKGAIWLQDSSVDLQDAISITIDGNIYALHTNGTITKLFRGSKQSFEISGLDPNLSEPDMIWTTDESSYLYILEGTNKRVVMLSKEGVFIKQFTAEAWVNPTSMAVDEANNTIYVLDDNKVWKFGF